jgi:hypothetical protein
MLRETADWLDFSIEHLSKWWKMLDIFEQQIVFDSAISKFEKYVGKGKEFPLEKDPAFKETIAVIAFQAYKSDKKQDQAFQLTLMSLGATIESLRRAGFGRVVVVGNGEKDEKATQETFRYLKEQIDGKKAKGDVSQIGNMEVGFTEFSFEDAKTKHLEKNIPRATLFGLRDAFYLSEKKEKQRAANETEYMKTWLGEDQKNWKYVYLTEPDSILQSRPSTLATLKEEVDKGTVLVPHRLQPIPHESDVRGSERNWLYIPEKEFETVMELDAIGEGDACCDEYQSGDGPGKTEFENCGNFWYMCPFGKRRKGDFSRLKPYKLMRLGQGTGIVSLASNEHARRCIPKRNGICQPPWLSQK